MIFYPTLVDDGSMYGWSYDFEVEDRAYIIEYIKENAPDFYDGEFKDTDTIEIPFINVYTEQEVMIEVKVSDYMTRRQNDKDD